MDDAGICWWQQVGQYAAEPPAWTRLYDSNRNTHMKLDDLIPSKFIKQSDVGEDEITVTIRKVTKQNVAGADEDPEYKAVVQFDEFDKPMVMGPTNLRRVADQHGNDVELWYGKQMILFVDPDVSYAGKRTGGLRVKAIRHPRPTRHQTMNDDDINLALDAERTKTPF